MKNENTTANSNYQQSKSLASAIWVLFASNGYSGKAFERPEPDGVSYLEYAVINKIDMGEIDPCELLNELTTHQLKGDSAGEQQILDHLLLTDVSYDRWGKDL